MLKLPESRYVLPNLFTLGSAFCGFALIWMAQDAESAAAFYRATVLIPVAVLLDGFDGRVARMMHGESEFGMHLDSLSDALTFGVAPAVLVYHWALSGYGILGLLAAFVFTATALVRLARFNVSAGKEEGVSRHFQGLPAPMAGLAIATLIGLDTGAVGHGVVGETSGGWVVAFVFLLGLLMISNVPFRTFKDMRFGWVNRLLVASAIGAVVVTSVLVDIMAGFALPLYAYLITGILAALFRRRRVTSTGEIVEEDGLFDPSFGIFDDLEEEDLLDELEHHDD